MANIFLQIVFCAAFVLHALVLLFALAAKRKTYTRISCIRTTLCVELWLLSLFLQDSLCARGTAAMLRTIENFKFLWIELVTVYVVFIAYGIVHANEKPPKRFLWLYAFPVLGQLLLWSDPLTGFFFASFPPEAPGYGFAFYLHCATAYALLFGTSVRLFRYARHGDSLVRAQAKLLLLGTAVPALADLLCTLGVFAAGGCAMPLAFAFTASMYIFAMGRHKVFRNAPIVLRTIVDSISYFCIVVDENLDIIDFNQQTESFFPPQMVKRGMNYRELMEKYPAAFEYERSLAAIGEARAGGKTLNLELVYAPDGESGVQRIFLVEFTPIVQQGVYRACVIMGQDITQARRNYASAVEQERLVAANQMISGVVQNLRAPVARLQNADETMNTLTKEYLDALEKGALTASEAKSIINELRQNLHCQTTSLKTVRDILAAVTEQTERISVERGKSFTVKALAERLDFLVKDKLLEAHCTLKSTVKLPEDTLVRGDINALAQVLANLVTNSIQAYQGKEGFIYFTVEEAAQSLRLSVGDYAGGIPEDIQDKLFKEVVSNKGGRNSGIGLYMAYATVAGLFQGRMWFATRPNEGTEFFVEVPSGN